MAYSLIGKAVPRFDGRIKVTGQAKYITDLSRPGMLHGKILFSDRTHAKILRIDTSKARALEGVRAVITAADAPARLYGLYIFDRTIFAQIECATLVSRLRRSRPHQRRLLKKRSV